MESDTSRESNNFNEGPNLQPLEFPLLSRRMRNNLLMNGQEEDNNVDLRRSENTIPLLQDNENSSLEQNEMRTDIIDIENPPSRLLGNIDLDELLNGDHSISSNPLFPSLQNTCTVVDSPLIKKIVDDFIKSIEKSNGIKLNYFLKDIDVNLNIESNDKTFILGKLMIKKKRLGSFNNPSYRITLNYKVKQIQNIFSYQLHKDFKTIYKIFESVLDIVWQKTVCKECFQISDEGLCNACTAVKHSWEYGIALGHAQYFPVCTICFEPVFSSHLECGHYFHKSCIVEYSKKTERNKLQCPNCRLDFTNFDKLNFYIE